MIICFSLLTWEHNKEQEIRDDNQNEYNSIDTKIAHHPTDNRIALTFAHTSFSYPFFLPCNRRCHISSFILFHFIGSENDFNNFMLNVEWWI